MMIVSFALWLGSCQKSEVVNKAFVVAHAGFGIDVVFNPYPSNSKSALDLLRLTGGKGVELDIQLSKDGQLFCFHDGRLDTRTNFSGCIPEFTAKELASLHYVNYASQPVARLEQMDFSGITALYLDLRHYNFCSESFIDPLSWIAPLTDFVAKHADKTIICMTNWLELATILHNANFEIAYETSTEEQAINSAENTPFKGVVYKNKVATQPGIDKIRKMEKKVIIFDVRSASGNTAALKKQPDVLITDAVEHALNY